MNTSSFDQKIINHNLQLTNNEMEVVKYIHKNPDEVCNDTISNLAKNTHYSASFISKVVKKVGYTSFAELKYDLKNDLYQKSKEQATSLLDIQNHDIEKTKKLLLQMDFSRINELFDTSDAIYVYGTGHSQMNYMRELSRNLMALVKVPVIFLSGLSEFESVLYTVQNTSCFIIASTTGETPILIDSVKILNLSEVPIISITKFSDNTLSNLSTLNLFYYSTLIKNPNGTKDIKSFLPLAYTVDYVIREYIDHLNNKHKYVER